MSGKFAARELRTLIGIEDFGLDFPTLPPMPPHKVNIHAVGEPPREHISAVPIHHGHQVKEAEPHRDVGDVAAPNLVGPHDSRDLSK